MESVRASCSARLWLSICSWRIVGAVVVVLDVVFAVSFCGACMVRDRSVDVGGTCCCIIVLVVVELSAALTGDASNWVGNFDINGSGSGSSRSSDGVSSPSKSSPSEVSSSESIADYNESVKSFKNSNKHTSSNCCSLLVNPSIASLFLKKSIWTCCFLDKTVISAASCSSRNSNVLAYSIFVAVFLRS